ncbi:MAG: cytidylate kinase-like family protein [Clostridia bacterium]|nr:cytidylate kinase-like family protein [Clostridia bacterium]
MKRVVTISREFGAGGHSLGKMVAEQLGIAFYDQQIIERAVAETGFSPEFVKEAGEYASTTHSFLFNLALSHSVSAAAGDLSNYDKIYIVQARIIRELADKAPCVIVGRCADYVLRDREDCFNVFVHADRETRARRVLEVYGEIEGKSIEERLDEKDKKRRLYYKHYTDRDWGILQNYHLTVNTGVIPTELAAKWICEAVK